MIKKTLLDRPALTALAAALTLASTPVLAQDAAPAAPPLPDTSVSLPPVSMPAPAPQTTAPAPAPISPVAVAPPALPDVPAQAQAAPPPERSTPARQVAERTTSTPRAARTTSAPATSAPVREPAVREAPSPAAAVPVAGSPAASPDTAPALTPSDLLAMQQRREAEQDAAATPDSAVPANATETDNGAYWVMGLGGASLVLGIGALAYLRRRDRREDVLAGDVVTSSAIPEPLPVAPVAARYGRESIPTAAVDAPVTEPEVAVVRAGRAPAKSRAQATSGFGQLEALVAEQPSAENPFVTRGKRLRRAKFILEHGGAPASSPIAEETLAEDIKTAVDGTPSRAGQKQPQKQPAFDYGKKPVSYRPTNWKPITT